MFPKKMRGKTPAAILKIVSEVEANAEELKGFTAGSNEYIKLGRWLVKSQYAKYPHKLPYVRKLTPLDSQGLWGRVRIFVKSLRPIRSICAADLICVKQNIRSFYMSETPVTAKIHINKHVSMDALEREFNIQKQVVNSGLLYITNKREVNYHANYPYCIEDVVDGSNVNYLLDKNLIGDFLEDLWGQYVAFGFELHDSSKFLSDSAYESIEAALIKIEWDESSGTQRGFLNDISRLINHKMDLLCGIGHGDLSTGNMISANGRIYLIDWENAGPMPIVFDILKLSLEFPEIRGFFAERIELEMKRLVAGPTPFPVQLAFAGVLHLSRLSQSVNKESAGIKERKRLSKAIDMFVNSFSDVRSLLSR